MGTDSCSGLTRAGEETAVQAEGRGGQEARLSVRTQPLLPEQTGKSAECAVQKGQVALGHSALQAEDQQARGTTEAGRDPHRRQRRAPSLRKWT